MGNLLFRLVYLFLVFFGAALCPAGAQSSDHLYVRPFGEVYFPLDTYNDPLTGQPKPLYSIGFGGGSILDYRVFPWLIPFVRGQFGIVPYAGASSLQFTEADLGVGFSGEFNDRFSVRLDAMGGLSQLSAATVSGSAYALGTRVSVDYRLAPAFTLSAGGGYTTFLGTTAPILSALTAGVAVTYNLAAFGGEKPKVTVEDLKMEAVFPSLYAYYDENPFGSLKVVNHEDASVTNVKISFIASHYMDQPKVCATFEVVKRGEALTVPIKALFTDSVLGITQGTLAKGEIVVEYNYLGSERVIHEPVDFQMHHRNAITWSDDRRAAAFVSPNNPAALWFAKYATGIVNDRLRGAINRPLQYAMGLFEAERLYGLNYVLVPANDYSVKHGIKDYIDSVQFPHQTLINRGGDCSDLAILFASLMQSVGIEAAFITIPGHIYAAFDTGLDEAAALKTFSDPGLVIMRDGRAWIPVEITMIKDGFLKAWRVAAKEWIDNTVTGNAAFYPLPDCWKKYPSTSFPGVDPRFILPPESDTAQAFDATLDRYVLREIVPQLKRLEAETIGADPVIRANELGILYASYGLTVQSWNHLSEAAKGGLAEAWTNLGNLAFLQKNFSLALSYYQYTLALKPADDVALLGVARCQFELEDFTASDQAYATLKSKNPELAARFGYLGSIFGGEGRAFSFAQRFTTTIWQKAAELTPVKTDVAQPVVLDTLPTEFGTVSEWAAKAANPFDKIVEVVPPVVPAAAPVKAAAPVEAAVAEAAPEEPAEVTEQLPVQTKKPGPVWKVVPLGDLHLVVQPLGKWQFGDRVLWQIGSDQFFSKLLTPAVGGNDRLRYSLSVRLGGEGWRGAGLQIQFGPSVMDRKFGEGKSWLVWLTTDPARFTKDVTRVQVFHSTSDVQMKLVAQAPVRASVDQLNRLTVELDGAAQTMTVLLHGYKVLRMAVPQVRGEGKLVAFRSINPVEFQDFLIEAAP